MTKDLSSSARTNPVRADRGPGGGVETRRAQGASRRQSSSNRWPGAFGRLIDPWLRRRWQADPEAAQKWSTLRPAAVVTGASEGIGLEIARRFADRGLTVVLVARRADELEAAVASINSASGGDSVAIPMDITSASAAEALEDELLRHGLYADILVNNAGMGLGGEFASHEPDRIAALISLNVRATTLLMHHFLPAMRARGRGGILNLASLGAFAPGPYQAAYYASKAYVLSLTEAVAWECRGEGVRIAAFAPGPVRTRFHAKMNAENSAYRWVLPAPSPAAAAGSAVRWFAWGRTVITPGLIGPLMAVAMRLTPHPILVPIIAWLLKPRDNGADAGH